MYLRLVSEAANAARKRRVHARAHIAAVGLALPAAALRLALAPGLRTLTAKASDAIVHFCDGKQS